MLLTNTRVWAVVAGLGLGAATAQATGSSPVAKQSAADQAAAELREHHRYHQSAGVMRFVAMSLDTLGTSDDAKRAEIEKLQGEMNAHMAPAREAEKELLQALADGVDSGTFDKAKVDAAMAKLTSATTARRDADYDTLDKIHKLLSREERAALVDKVEAHWEVWKSVNDESKTKASARGGRLEELTEEASLTPDQKTKMSAALKAAGDTPSDPTRAEARVRAFTAGFTAESFAAHSLASKGSSTAGRGSSRLTLFYQTVAPLLTAEQRTKVAENLREHASYEPASSGK
jgi:Spy/CpxP family protein refolding chaperone